MSKTSRKVLFPGMLERRCETRRKAAKHRTEKYLRKYYGPRCKSYEPGCLCCETWKAFDVVFAAD